MRQLVAKVLSIGADPADDEELRLRKVLLLTAALAILPLAIVWGAVYFAAGARVAGLIPWVYAGLSVLSIGVFSVVRTYWWFGISQLVLYVVLPFLLMWVLGGFVEGSVVGSFAAIAPLGALLLGHRRLAPILLGVYAVLVLVTPLVVGSGVIAGLHEPSLPGGLLTAFFMMNLLAVPILGWVLVYAFSGGRQELLSAARGVVRRYFAPDMAAAILADPRRQELGGEMADVTVMFADLGGFTSFAEHHAPAEVVDAVEPLLLARDPCHPRRGRDADAAPRRCGDGRLRRPRRARRPSGAGLPRSAPHSCRDRRRGPWKPRRPHR